MIAVIIPCFNNESYLAQAIDSVLEEDLSGLEVVVVDDGSSDGSTTVARSYGRRVRLIEQGNQGACVARNKGLAESSAPYVKFLDADDYLLPGSLSRQLDQAGRVDERSIVFGAADWVDTEGEVIRRYAPERDLVPSEFSPAEIVEETPLTSCPLHRRSLLEEIGGFDPRCTRGQEHDLHVRLALSGGKFLYHGDPTYCYRQHNTSRISDLDGDRKTVENRLEATLRHVDLAMRRFSSTTIPADLAEAFGRQLWRLGRQASRLRCRSIAGTCFREAKSLGGDRAIVGSRTYRFACGLLKPSWLG